MPEIGLTDAHLAFLYASGEMNARESAAFERRLGEEQLLREALCQAVQRMQTLEGLAPPTPRPAYRQRVRQRLHNKSEIRNPKSERNLKNKSLKSETAGFACFVFSSSFFGFLSDFGFRISDLLCRLARRQTYRGHPALWSGFGAAAALLIILIGPRIGREMPAPSPVAEQTRPSRLEAPPDGSADLATIEEAEMWAHCPIAIIWLAPMRKKAGDATVASCMATTFFTCLVRPASNTDEENGMRAFAWLLGGVFVFTGLSAAVPPGPTASSLPRFTEEREAAALFFVKKHVPEVLPLLGELKKNNSAQYQQEIREVFQATEMFADLQDDPRRHDLELKIWKTEIKAHALVAKLSTPKEERKKVEASLHEMARELVALDIQVLELRADQLDRELGEVKDELARTKEQMDKSIKAKYDALLEQAKK